MWCGSLRDSSSPRSEATSPTDAARTPDSDMDPIITVITPTTGKPGLDMLISSIEKQTLPGRTFHYLLWDNNRDPAARSPESYNSTSRLSIVTPDGFGRNGLAPGSPLRAVGLMAAMTPWVTFADDDVTWESDHVETMLDAVDNHHWASTLRKIFAPGGGSLVLTALSQLATTRRDGYPMRCAITIA